MNDKINPLDVSLRDLKTAYDKARDAVESMDRISELLQHDKNTDELDMLLKSVEEKSVKIMRLLAEYEFDMSLIET